MKNLVVARKYAQALFAEVQSKNELQAVQQGLEEFVRVARFKAELKQVLAHPFIDLAEKKNVIHAVLGGSAMPVLEKFLMLLVSRRRLDQLYPIALEFKTLVGLWMKVQSLSVTTAFALSDTQQKLLQEKLEKWCSSKVHMDVQVDESLIGGLVVQSRDYVLDQSLKGQLKKLEQQLTA